MFPKRPPGKTVDDLIFFSTASFKAGKGDQLSTNAATGKLYRLATPAETPGIVAGRAR